MIKIFNKRIKLTKKQIIVAVTAFSVLFCCVLAGIFFFKPNTPDEPTLEEIVSEKLLAYETDLTDSLTSMKNNTDVAKYLMNWATNKNIPAMQDSYGNVIFQIKSKKTENNDKKNGENADSSSNSNENPANTAKLNGPVVILCEYDAANMPTYTKSIATALTVAKNSRNNDKFRIIFSPSVNGNLAGISNLSPSYFTGNERIICLGNSGTSKVAITTGGYKQILLSDLFDYTAPSYDTAYKISIKGLPSGPLDNRMNGSVNPIKILGNLMANFKSTSLLFELASFYGGQDANLTPSNASMTIVVNSGDATKLTNKLDKAIEKFYDRYGEDYPEAKYTYKEVKLPKQVFSHQITENVIGLMYTAINGVYYKDNDGAAVAISNIGKLSTKNGNFKMNVSVLSYSPEYLDEMTDSYRTSSGLCDVKFKVVNKYPIYSGGGAASSLLSDFEVSFLQFTDDSEMKCENAVELTPCSTLFEKNSELAIIWLGVTTETKNKFAGSLIQYLDRSN